jgi:DNA repair protein RadC
MLPREKLFSLGPKELESWELLSILFGHGTKKESVFSCAQRVIRGYGWTLPGTFHPDHLKKIFALHDSSAARLSVCMELGFRLFNQLNVSITLNNADKVHDFVKEMSLWQKEGFRALYVNSRYQLIWDEVVSMGSLTASSVHPREVFIPAIKVGAAAVILIHNHPSGDPTPSDEDKRTTVYLLAAAEIMHIPILDHIIIGKKSCFSFQDHGLMHTKQELYG